MCADGPSCGAKLATLVERLDATHELMRNKHLTLRALEELRQGILSGKRVELPSAERQHLERGFPLVSEISFDARHKPVSTNMSRHMQRLRLIGDSDVKFYQFLPLKRPTSGGAKPGPAALLVIVDTRDLVSLYTLDGECLIDKMDLGHGEGKAVLMLALSPNQDNHFIVTGDDGGELRHHALKITARKDAKKGGKGSNDTASEASGVNASSDKSTPALTVSVNFTASVEVGTSLSGEPRKLTSVIAVERGKQNYYVTGDSLGGISIFHRNGTLKGRVRVTEDFGGVKGLLRGQGQTLLFYSSHSFGFFSVSQLDVQSPPCTGWNSPLFDVAVDPSMMYSKVMLALSDGDVLVFTTTRGKSKACDLTLKFPRVSPLPFKLHVFRGHVIGLPVISEDVENKSSYSDLARELYFFNMAAMEAGYGVSPSRAVTLQAIFRPKKPDSYAILGTGTGSGDKAKSHVAIRFEGRPGVELYELSLKPPPAARASSSGGGGSSLLGGSDDSGSGWLDWFPKIGVFGLALVGVVIWNVRKVTAQQRHESLDDFDDSYFKEKLKERRAKGKGKEDNDGGIDRDDDGSNAE